MQGEGARKRTIIVTTRTCAALGLGRCCALGTLLVGVGLDARIVVAVVAEVNFLVVVLVLGTFLTLVHGCVVSSAWCWFTLRVVKRGTHVELLIELLIRYPTGRVGGRVRGRTARARGSRAATAMVGGGGDDVR